MANDLITPDTIADLAIANLYDNAVMANLVNRDYEDAFVGQVGDTVTVRNPTTFEAKTFTREQGIQIQDAKESKTTITLDKFKDVSFAVTSEDWTLEVQNFNTQFVQPAVKALIQQIDRDILAEATRNKLASVGSGNSAHSADQAKVLIDAGATLDTHAVPQDDRNMVASAMTSADWLADPIFHEADKRGNTTGLREAEIGHKFGFDTYMDQNVASHTAKNSAGTSVTVGAIGFHQNAFTLATRPLAQPRGAAAASTRSYNGIGLRVVYDYDIQKKQDVVSIDVLYGVQTLDPKKAVLVLPSGSSSGGSSTGSGSGV